MTTQMNIDADVTDDFDQPDIEDVNAFSFGDPEPVLNNRMTDYLGTFAEVNGKYYIPPVSLSGIDQITRANGHHESALYFKRNMLMKYWNDHPLIKRVEMRYAAHDWHTFGMAYFQVHRNAFGGITRLSHLPAINMRVGIKPGTFFMVKKDGSEIEFKIGEVIQLKETDTSQKIYGVPQYLAGIQSILLSEDTTLFRRKYYKNGAHMGYVFVTYDLGKEQVEKVKGALAQSKGPGNFRPFFLNMKSGHNKANLKDRVQMKPVGELEKDDYEKIKMITQQDVLNMHRVPPALAGMMPLNVGGFGDVEKIDKIYYENEVVPMQQVILELNDHLPASNPIVFDKPDFKDAA